MQQTFVSDIDREHILGGVAYNFRFFDWVAPNLAKYSFYFKRKTELHFSEYSIKNY